MVLAKESKMNQRIRELLGQAYDEAVPETWTTLSSEQLERIYEKFAELIVKETMQVVANNLPQNTYLDVADAVIEHFGVEE